jgi:very-short-patch-repair endonuclease
MEYKYNKKLLGNASYMRKNMTPEERHLWYDFLKKLPITVNRQKTIGNYIVDFYIHSYKIVIEVDGVQHKTKTKHADQIRDAELRALGITVLRYSNIAINENFNYVCENILKHLGLNIHDLKASNTHGKQ